MNRIKAFPLLFLFSCLLFFSCSTNDLRSEITISVFLEGDSIGAFLTPVKIFIKGEKVIDTTTNFDGKLKLLNKFDKIYVSYSGCYPKFLTLEDLILDSNIILEKSRILDNYPSTDSMLNIMNEKANEEIKRWNDLYGN